MEILKSNVQMTLCATALANISSCEHNILLFHAQWVLTRLSACHAESSQSEYQQDTDSQSCSMDFQPGIMAASSLRSSMDGAVQLTIDGREPAATTGEPAVPVSRRRSLRMSSDGSSLPGPSSHHSSLRNSSDGGLPPLRSWRGSLQNSCDSGLPFVTSRRESSHNSSDVASQPNTAADAGALMHRLSNLSSAVRSDGFDSDDVEDDLSQAGSSASSDGFQDTCAKDLARDDLDGDGQPLASPTNQFSDFSFKNYGLLAEHNMEALRAEFAEAHAEKGNASSSADERTSVQ